MPSTVANVVTAIAIFTRPFSIRNHAFSHVSVGLARRALPIVRHLRRTGLVQRGAFYSDKKKKAA
ncbi:MAG: hypothetical protein WA324_28855 [Bryobacteraceae bacterium]